MDVILEVQGGNSLSIAVDPLDTVRDVKEKVQNLNHIPISHQTFIFNGQLLQDDLHLWESQIDRGSRIHLLVANDDAENPASLDMPPSNITELDLFLASIDMPASNIKGLEKWLPSLDMLPSNREELEEMLPSLEMPPPRMTLREKLFGQQGVPAERTRVTFRVKMIETKRVRSFPMEMYLYDTVLCLKEKIYNLKKPENIKAKDMEVLLKSGYELKDQWSLQDCGMLNISHVYVRKRLAQPREPGTDAHFGTKMLNLMLVPKGGTQKIPIQVNILNSVGDMRFELEKFHRHVLPQDLSYFFTNKKGHVMSETLAFNWFRLEDGDTIEITPASI
ncbi:Nedd8, partial [Mucuna pruriens]